MARGTGKEKPVLTVKAGEDPPINVRVYSDGISPSKPQPLHEWLLAAVTLSLYVGFLNYFLVLIIASIWSRMCLCLVVALFSTLLLPCQPVLWPAFNRLWIFKTW